MICDTCKKDKAKGEVAGGKFQCADCKAQEGAKLGALIKFYAISSPSSRKTPVTIVSAIYKEGKMYFTRQQADNGWPHDAKVHKQYWGRVSEPGYRTAQEAVDELIQARSGNVEYKRKELERATDELDKVLADAEAQGFITVKGEAA